MTIQNVSTLAHIRIVILRGANLRKIQLFSFFINDITPKKSKTKKKLIFQKKYFFSFSIVSNLLDGLQIVSEQATTTM